MRSHNVPNLFYVAFDDSSMPFHPAQHVSTYLKVVRQVNSQCASIDNLKEAGDMRKFYPVFSNFIFHVIGNAARLLCVIFVVMVAGGLYAHLVYGDRCPALRILRHHRVCLDSLSH